MAKHTKKVKPGKQYVEGTKAQNAFESAMKTIFRAPKKPVKGKD